MKAGNLVRKAAIILEKRPVITPGFIKSFKKSAVTSFALFLSSFLEMGNGREEMRAFIKSGIDSNMALSFAFDLWRKDVRSS